jgi:hypothetical protein
MILYHYTTKSLFSEMTRSKNPFSKDFWKSMGGGQDGWTFTDISPDNCNVLNLAFCQKNVYVFSKIECYLKFDVPENLVQKTEEHLFKVKDWDKRIQYVEGQATPKCANGPCLMCGTIAKMKKVFGFA